MRKTPCRPAQPEWLELVTPVAEALRARGVPFVLASAYDHVDQIAPVLSGAPNVGKPFVEGRLLATLTRASSPNGCRRATG